MNKNWIPDKYCSAFGYKQYYYPYTYDRQPYFESDMISCHNMKYDPKRYKLLYPKTITLGDDSVIEKFTITNQSSFIFILIFLLYPFRLILEILCIYFIYTNCIFFIFF